MKRLAIFASGSGTNAQNIIEYFRKTGTAAVSVVFCNNSNAFVLERAKLLSVPVCLFNKTQFYVSGYVAENLRNYEIDFIVLAGFLWLIPKDLIFAFRNRIINIHPALLPKYGGKGMFGMAVHEAAIASGDRVSGISIHFVDEKYDHGNIIFQAHCPILPGDTSELLAQKIHSLEYEHFPKIIERVVIGQK